MKGRKQGFPYDVFISYSHKNIEIVRDWLLPELKKAGLKVCIDYECFTPGEPSLNAMEQAVLTSRRTLLILTPDYVKSEWCEFENILVQTLDPAARHRRIIPALFESCKVPLRVSMLIYVDFTKEINREFELQRLIGAIKDSPSPVRSSYSIAKSKAESYLQLEDAGSQVLFEGVFSEPGQASLAFTVFNPFSEKLLVVSDVSIIPIYFKLIQTPKWHVFYEGIRRTKLLVDIVEVGQEAENWKEAAGVPFSDGTQIRDIKHGKPGHFSKYEMGGANRQTSLLGPDRVVHIAPQCAESFLVALKSRIDDSSQFGFVCFLIIKVTLALQGTHSKTIMVDRLFEISRNPSEAELYVTLHPVELAQPVLTLFTEKQETKLNESVKEITSLINAQDFSFGFLYDLAFRIASLPSKVKSKAITAYLEISNKAVHAIHTSELWLSTLEKILEIITAGHKGYEDYLSVLYNSQYPYLHRLMAARLLAGLSGVAPSVEILQRGMAQSTSGKVTALSRDTLKQFATSFLWKTEEDGKTQAILTLAEFGDDESINEIVEYIAESEDEDVQRVGVRVLERESDIRFLCGPLRWTIRWHLILLMSFPFIWLAIAFLFIGARSSWLKYGPLAGWAAFVCLAFKFTDRWERWLLNRATKRAVSWYKHFKKYKRGNNDL